MMGIPLGTMDMSVPKECEEVEVGSQLLERFKYRIIIII